MRATILSSKKPCKKLVLTLTKYHFLEQLSSEDEQKTDLIEKRSEKSMASNCDSWRHRRPRSVQARAPAPAPFVSVSFCLLPSPPSLVDMLATLVMEDDCVAQIWSSRSWFWASVFLAGEAARRKKIWRLGGGSAFRLRVWNPNFPFVLFMKLGRFWTAWRCWAWCAVSVLWNQLLWLLIFEGQSL